MTQVTEAIYSRGVLRPIGELVLQEAQRVRVIVQPLDEPRGDERSAALQRLLAGIESMAFSSGGPLPSRDGLHDRS